VTLATGSIHHWEALLRLRDLQGKLIYPDRFIPVAEKTGQIQAIDHWVLAHAIQCLGREPSLRLGINLSGRAMDDPALPLEIERLLGEHRVEPTRLILEVTETAAVSSLVKATELMKAVQRLGCGFVLDDFGTGYASYAYLRRLPVDEVKIDGAFIRDLANNREDRIFVKAITDMAHGMGKGGDGGIRGDGGDLRDPGRIGRGLCPRLFSRSPPAGSGTGPLAPGRGRGRGFSPRGVTPVRGPVTLFPLG
jgi:EAL domain-containing protein (putative c-di-GMP-specific phosphodiesterase class I)